MKPKTIRKYHTLLYETINGLIADARHKVWSLAFNISEKEHIIINDLIHDIFIYIVNDDKLYERCEVIIESEENIKGFLYRIMENYLRKRFRKLNYETKRKVHWSELIKGKIDKYEFNNRRQDLYTTFVSQSFRKEDTLSEIGYSEQEQIDNIFFHSGMFASSPEDIFLKYEQMIRLKEPERTICKLFFEGKNFRQISEITGLSISTISRKLKKLKIFSDSVKQNDSVMVCN
jgi:RNA polymerase sigma factor (sigma-70 family)